MAATKVYTVRAPNGKVYSVRGPANATQAQLTSAILKAHPEAKGTGRVPLKGGLGKIETFGMGLGRGIDEAMFGTANLIGKGFEFLGATDTGKAIQGYAKRNLDQSTAAYEPFLRTNPLTAEGGRIGGNIIGLVAPGKAATAPLNVLAKAAPKVAPVVQAITSGGMSTGITTTRVGAKEAALAKKAVDAVLRIGGGATAGVASSAVLGQDIEEGGAVGAAVSMIPLVGRYGIAPVWDALRGRVGDARAARIFREALGANYDAARQIFASTKGEARRTASQVLTRMGLDADQFFATGQVVARQGETTGILDDIARGQQASQLATLNAAAGGTTRTASRDAAAAQRRATSATAGPIREEALGNVNAATGEILNASLGAQQTRALANRMTQSGIVPRMRGLEERAAGQAELMADNPALFPDMARIQQTRGIAGAAGQRANDAIQAQIALRDAARTAEQRIANLQAAGVQALDPNALSSRFRALAQKERANPERASVFSGFADEIQRLASENGGVLDAFDLYEIRKDAGAIVERMLAGRATPEAVRKRTAEVIGAARPLIDDTIEAAGGKRWREYLDTFSTGMDEARKIEFSDYARSVFEKNPEDYQRLMEGQRPEIVERFFGKGKYDVNEVLAPRQVTPQGPTLPGQMMSAMPQGPSRLPAMQGVAADIADDVRIKNAMTPGATARAEKALTPPPNMMVRVGQTLPFGVGGFIEQPARLFDEFKNARVTQALEKGFASPQGASDLLNYRPSGEKLFIGIDAFSPDVQRTLQQFGIQLGREEPNYMTMIR